MFRVCFVILSPFQRMKLVAFIAFDSREFGKIAHAVVCVLLVQHIEIFGLFNYFRFLSRDRLAFYVLK